MTNEYFKTPIWFFCNASNDNEHCRTKTPIWSPFAMTSKDKVRMINDEL